MSTDTFILKRIEELEQELRRLRKVVSRRAHAKRIKLRGIWKGVNISDKEMKIAKRSLFREV